MKKIYYHYTEWEDYQNGMYKKRFTKQQENELIKKSETLLKNPKQLYEKMKEVTTKWKHSSKINLSNYSCNRQAWLGAAACCIFHTCPEHLTKQAWHNLNESQKTEANKIADKIILEFMEKSEINAQTKIKC